MGDCNVMIANREKSFTNFRVLGGWWVGGPFNQSPFVFGFKLAFRTSDFWFDNINQIPYLSIYFFLVLSCNILGVLLRNAKIFFNLNARL